jgi:hypothetical protein
MEFGPVNSSRPVWKQRGLAILCVLAFVGPALILTSFAGSMIGNLRTWLPAQNLPIGEGISLVVAILLDIALFMLLYILLPHGTSSWRELLPWRAGGRPALGVRQESIFVIYFHLHLHVELGLWIGGSHYRFPYLGLPERPDLSIWGFPVRLLLPVQTKDAWNSR